MYYANCLIVPRKASLPHFQGYSEHQAMFTNRVHTEYKHNPRTRNTEYRLTPVEYTHTTRTIHKLLITHTHNTEYTMNTHKTEYTMNTHKTEYTHQKKCLLNLYNTTP